MNIFASILKDNREWFLGLINVNYILNSQNLTCSEKQWFKKFLGNLSASTLLLKPPMCAVKRILDGFVHTAHYLLTWHRCMWILCTYRIPNTYMWASLATGSGSTTSGQIISEKNLFDITDLLIEKSLIKSWGIWELQSSPWHNLKIMIYRRLF